MAFKDFTAHQQPVALLQRSLAQGRLGHAYLFTGSSLDDLEAIARTLAKTVNCQSPSGRSARGLPLDSCDACSSCRRIAQGEHPDVHELRPESKLRQITIDQVRDLIRAVHLKPHEAICKVGIITAADRLNAQASNAFLKTLEEPPDRSVLLLLTTEPERLLETVLSRCLRLPFGQGTGVPKGESLLAWLKSFAEMAAAGKQGLLGRYQLLGLLLTELGTRKSQIDTRLTARSPLERHEDLEPALKDKWQAELAAAIEAEYRRQRAETLGAALWWMRDIWLLTLGVRQPQLGFPDLLSHSQAVARRITSREAMENLRNIEQTQRLLTSTNVQEALALEVGLLRLRL